MSWRCQRIPCSCVTSSGVKSAYNERTATATWWSDNAWTTFFSWITSTNTPERYRLLERSRIIMQRTSLVIIAYRQLSPNQGRLTEFHVLVTYHLLNLILMLENHKKCWKCESLSRLPHYLWYRELEAVHIFIISLSISFVSAIAGNIYSSIPTTPDFW